MQVIVHLGLPKCGSSAIQSYLAENRFQLARQRISYPISGRGEIESNGNGNLRAFSKYLASGNQTQARDALFSLLEDAAESDKVVFSSEDLSIIDNHKVLDVFTSCGVSNSDISFLYVVRPFKEFLWKVFMQTTRNPQSIDNWSVETFLKRDHSIWLRQLFHSVESQISMGINTEILKYSSNVVLDFANLLGIKHEDDFVDARIVLPSFSPGVLAAVRALRFLNVDLSPQSMILESKASDQERRIAEPHQDIKEGLQRISVQVEEGLRESVRSMHGLNLLDEMFCKANQSTSSLPNDHTTDGFVRELASALAPMFKTSFPLAFDVDLYRNHQDLQTLDPIELVRHWCLHGIEEGRKASEVTNRSEFAKIISGFPSILEISPWGNPLLVGPNVKYCDIYSTSELKEKCPSFWDPDAIPEMDFVLDFPHPQQLSEKFEAIVSSHVIEHTLDLVSHLDWVYSHLCKNGIYALAIPDHRYCFDHFIEASSLADVLDAHLSGATNFSLQKVLQHIYLTTHNDPVRHWIGDHGERRKIPDSLTSDQLAHATNVMSNGIHAWQFTPTSFGKLISELRRLDTCGFKVERLYPTLRNSLEFYCILRKVD